MTPTPDDTGALAKILGGLGTAAAIVGGWLLKHTHDKIDTKVDRTTFEDRSKSSDERHQALVSEMNMQRGNVKSIFEDIADFKRDTNHQFQCLTKDLNEKHVALINAIANIKK